MFIRLFSSIGNASNHTKCMLLRNQKCMTQPTIINLHPSGYSQELHYYQFAVNLDGCLRSCSTLNDLSNKVCVSNKTKDLNLSTFYMNTGISCECNCKFDSWRCSFLIFGICKFPSEIK